MPSENSSLKIELKSICENLKKSKNTCSMYSFQSVVDKCLTDKKILNRDVIIECLAALTNLMPSKLLEDLFKKSIELNDMELCYSLINNVQVLEESQSVDCIKFFLNAYKEDEMSDQSESDIIGINKNLSLLFIKPYDYRLFTNELKRLSSKEFLYCLQYLQNFLKDSLSKQNSSPNSSQESLDDVMDQDDSKVPTIRQVVDLFCCFVDAHFTHVILSGKAQELIADALQLIETQLELYYEYLSIESLIKEYKNNKEFQMKTNNNMGIYSIEVLKF